MHHSYALRRVVGDVGDGGLTFGGAHAGLHRRRDVISLTQRRLAGLVPDDRPLPSVAAYDDLLGKASS